MQNTISKFLKCIKIGTLQHYIIIIIMDALKIKIKIQLLRKH